MPIENEVRFDDSNARDLAQDGYLSKKLDTHRTNSTNERIKKIDGTRVSELASILSQPPL